MKVCCIGDVHGTNKFLECYEDILKNNNDCEKIIVFGDHFDPYENIKIDDLLDRYNKFIQISKEDNRIVSLLGNHDLAYYIIRTDETNRTSRRNGEKIREAILPNLKDSYLCYKIDNYLFSHAGVSTQWMEKIHRMYVDDGEPRFDERILNNYTGWTETELTNVVSFDDFDFSHCGDHPLQGCTWIRPGSLYNNAIDGYNQIVAHTRTSDGEIKLIRLPNGKKLWLIDTGEENNYLTLNI